MTYTVTVLPAGRKLSAQPGENLLALLRSANLAPEAPCGGNGKCGKCTVQVDGKPMLACGYPVSGDVTVHVTATLSLIHISPRTPAMPEFCPTSAWPPLRISRFHWYQIWKSP